MTITEPKIYPFVYVKWKDASHASGTWQNECEDALEPVLDCETGGFLIKRTDEFIIVAAAIAYHEDVETPSFASEITIPMCAVSEIRTIERDGNKQLIRKYALDSLVREAQEMGFYDNGPLKGTMNCGES